MVPLASMGDIAFLLIIFFMLVGSLMKTANVAIENPESEDVIQQDSPQITVILDEEGVLWLQGVTLDKSALADGVQALAGGHADRSVHVRIHRTHLRRDFMPVLEALSEAGVKLVLEGALPTRNDVL